MRETYDIQNDLARIERSAYLNVENPTTKLKRQYHKAIRALQDARHEFDLLNDMKDGHTKTTKGWWLATNNPGWRKARPGLILNSMSGGVVSTIIRQTEPFGKVCSVHLSDYLIIPFPHFCLSKPEAVFVQSFTGIQTKQTKSPIRVNNQPTGELSHKIPGSPLVAGAKTQLVDTGGEWHAARMAKCLWQSIRYRSIAVQNSRQGSPSGVPKATKCHLLTKKRLNRYY